MSIKLKEHNFITLYKSVDFSQDDNMAFEDINSHLSLFQKYYPVDIGPNAMLDNYALETRIKLNLAKYTDDLVIYANCVNYVGVSDTETGTPTKFYFVKNIAHNSEEVIYIDLALDTLNSFTEFTTKSTYWSNRTVTSRQHKDRWKKDGSTLKAIIDRQDEGFGSLPMYKKSDEKINPSVTSNKFYLVYKSTGDDSNSPIKCYLYSEKELKCYCYTKMEINLIPYFTTTNRIYWDYKMENGKKRTFQINGTLYDNVSMVFFDFENKKCYYSTGDYLNEYGYIGYNVPVTQILTLSSDKGISYLGTEDLPVNKYYKNYNMKMVQTRSTVYYCDMISNLVEPTSKTQTSYTLASIEEVDRTDSKLNKIVECPYLPLKYTESNNYMIFDYIISGAKSGPLTIDAFNKSQLSVLKSYSYDELGVNKSVPTFTQDSNKSIDYESKLLNSQFSKIKFTYDSFSKELKLEDLGTATSSCTVSYAQSVDMSSKCLFKIDAEQREYDDFDKYLLCSRSNESVIYSSSYLNYIRTGYNYDMKAKSLQNIHNGLSVASSIIGTATSVGVALGTGGLGVGQAVNQGVGLVNNIASVVMNNISSDNNLARKKDEALASSVSVVGADDLSLFNLYSDNKLYKFNYQLRDELKDSIYELFYLTGYSSNDYGVPNINSRKNFNYIKANTTFDTNINIPTKVKEDLITRINNGMFVIHKSDTSLYQLFTYENWETSIYE